MGVRPHWATVGRPKRGERGHKSLDPLAATQARRRQSAGFLAGGISNHTLGTSSKASVRTSCRQGGATYAQHWSRTGCPGCKGTCFLLAVIVHIAPQQISHLGRSGRPNVRSMQNQVVIGAPETRRPRSIRLSQGPGRWPATLLAVGPEPGWSGSSEGQPPWRQPHAPRPLLPGKHRLSTGGRKSASLVEDKPPRGPTQGLWVVVVTTWHGGQWGWGCTPAATRRRCGPMSARKGRRRPRRRMARKAAKSIVARVAGQHDDQLGAVLQGQLTESTAKSKCSCRAKRRSGRLEHLP